MAILAPAVRQGSLVDAIALAAVVGVMWKTDNVALASVIGLSVLMFGATLVV